MKVILLLSLLSGPLEVRTQVLEGDHEPKVGVPIELEVTARHQETGVAVLPGTLDLPSVLAERSSARLHQRSRAEGEGAIVDRYVLQIFAFEPGLIEVPPIPVAVGSTTTETAPVLIEVGSNLSDEEIQATSSTAAKTLEVLEQMAAANPPPAVLQVFDPRPLVALALAVGAMVAIAGVAWVLSRPKPPKAAPPKAPPHELAMQALRQLEARSELDTPESLNPYYTELSSIVRRYLGQRFGLDALEKTPQELLDSIDARGIASIDRSRLSQLLFEAEQAKFAKYAPSIQSAKDALDIARSLVADTQPMPEASA